MSDEFLSYKHYLDFLADRYQYLKLTKPFFSARYFCRLSGVKSPSYLGLILTRKRKLSVDYAKKFAQGLLLTANETDLLVATVTWERSAEDDKPKYYNHLLKLKQRIKKRQQLQSSHIKILSDVLYLKLYLLAQSLNFKFDINWIYQQFPESVNKEKISQGVDLLIRADLWEYKDGKISLNSPFVDTFDTSDDHLPKMHENIISESLIALQNHTYEDKAIEGVTFLFDKKHTNEVREKVKHFKQEIEAKYETITSSNVYQLHVSFFEIAPK